MTRKKTVLCLTLAGLLLMLGAAALQAGTSNKPKSKVSADRFVRDKEMTIPGNEPWTPTGIFVDYDDTVTIKATGKICFMAGRRESCVGPSGMGGDDYQRSWRAEANACSDPFAASGHGALIGKIEDYGYFPFAVTGSKSFTGHKGSLHLGINDCAFTGDSSNTGGFDVTISIKRGRPSDSQED